MWPTLVVLAVLTDIAPPPPFKKPMPAPVECVADAECVLSTFAGCCGSCCPADPYAVRRDSTANEPCGIVMCGPRDCRSERCRPARNVSELVAACRANRCVALPKAQATAQCRADAECRVVEAAPPAGAACHQSACGCCPVSQAVPVDAVVPLQRRAPGGNPPKEETGKPAFGLSTGESAPRPQCSPCPAPVPARAACQSGQCVLVPGTRRPPFPG